MVELLAPGADRIPDRCTHGGEPCPGAPWQGLAVRAPAGRSSANRSTRRCGGSAASTASSWSRSSPPSSSGATATSSNTPSASDGGEPIARLPRPRPLGPGRRRRRLPARLRGRQRRPQRGPRLGPAGVDPGLRRPRPRSRGAAQPGRPRGAAHGADPDPPRHRRSATSPNRPSTCTRSSPSDSGSSEGPTGVLARGVPEGGALRAEVEDLPRRLLPDQHRDGRAPLCRRRRVRRAERQREGLRPVLRDRHDRADDGGRGPARSGAWRSSPRRSPTPSATPG